MNFYESSNFLPDNYIQYKFTNDNKNSFTLDGCRNEVTNLIADFNILHQKNPINFKI